MFRLPRVRDYTTRCNVAHTHKAQASNANSFFVLFFFSFFPPFLFFCVLFFLLSPAMLIILSPPKSLIQSRCRDFPVCSVHRFLAFPDFELPPGPSFRFLAPPPPPPPLPDRSMSSSTSFSIKEIKVVHLRWSSVEVLDLINQSNRNAGAFRTSRRRRS